MSKYHSEAFSLIAFGDLGINLLCRLPDLHCFVLFCLVHDFMIVGDTKIRKQNNMSKSILTHLAND